MLKQAVTDSGESQVKEQSLTIHDVNRAWKYQLDAVDRFEQASIIPGYSQERLDELFEEMIEATEDARRLEDLYHDQYRRREYHDDGRWTVREAA